MKSGFTFSWRFSRRGDYFRRLSGPVRFDMCSVWSLRMTDYSHYRRLNALPPLVRHWLECQYDGPIPLSAIEQAERNQAQMTAIDAQDQKIAG